MEEFLIYRTSSLTGKRHSKTIFMKYADYLKYLKNETTIDEALPYLTITERAFIVNGVVGEEL